MTSISLGFLKLPTDFRLI